VNPAECRISRRVTCQSFSLPVHKFAAVAKQHFIRRKITAFQDCLRPIITTLPQEATEDSLRYPSIMFAAWTFRPPSSSVRIALLCICMQFAATAANYSYDTAGRLVRADYGSSGVVVYTYDQAGNLVARAVQSPPGTGVAVPVITAVVNAEGGSPTIAPNTWVEINGTSLAQPGDSRTWQSADLASNQLPTQLDGVSVTVNGKSAFVYYISPTQVNILTPPDPMQGTVQVQLSVNAATSKAFSVQAQTASPSFFVFSGGYVCATHADGSLIGPTTLYPARSTPAVPGETILLFGNGFGPTSSPVTTTSLSQFGSLPTLPVVKIGGAVATVQFAGLISAGLYQFNVVVPPGAAKGDSTIISTYNGASTQAGILILIQQ
jgi:uncharacterized protein (TIGR03437 family)